MSTIGPEAYAQTLAEFRPHLIQNEKEAEAIHNLIDLLLSGNEELPPDDEEFVAFLGYLILAREKGKYPSPSVSPREMILALLEDNHLRQSDLIGPVFSQKSHASEVLRGQRDLTYDHVSKLSRFFNVSPDVFYPRDSS